MHFRIATYNIHRCIGRDKVKNLSRVAAVLNEINADIVALQEVTSSGEESTDMLAGLALATGMNPVEGFTLNTTGTRYGNAILTRLPLSATHRIDISVAGKEPRGVVEVVLPAPDSDNSTITIWATHLGLGFFERRMQIKKLLKIIERKESDVSVLLGDFNEWLVWGGILDAVKTVFARSFSPATFPAWKPLLKLDRIWVKPVDNLTVLSAHVTPLSISASDHLPLVAEISAGQRGGRPG